MKDKDLDNYKSSFTECGLINKISRYAKKIGLKLVYSVLLLFYAYKRKETPRWAKNIIIGILGYFVSPIDAIPDLTPFIGYTDDLSLIVLGLITISVYINDEVKKKAKTDLARWFDEIDEDIIAEVDEDIN